MSVRLYIGNLPQNLKLKELEALFAGIGKGIRFKAVLDRETKACRGFGFANVDDEKLANEVIEQLNGHEFNGNNLRVERSERKESNHGSGRRNNSSGASKTKAVKRKDVKKVVHSDAPNEQAPDPRWAGELSKLKELLANQKTAV
ncbi:RNA recognition motif domain-containing protein [Prochlorococcus marinus]|uniref:RNA-binding region RNP-1 (RNA recognition motif) n=1 Tax=Prochlorococcus marinus (strain MIT 9211) TaxID=93059 RepID=A9BD00_PROM4|nr:RNA-binding protein [Prochlorococcus marinus]ABX08088.1 RNA-binding region RNP-1 (RNA recognition motif) [Prochlorococcus marinus str. MIT 9211]